MYKASIYVHRNLLYLNEEFSMKWTEDYITYKHFTIENKTVKVYKNETDYVIISLPSTPDTVHWSESELDIWCNGDLRTYFGPNDYMIIR